MIIVRKYYPILQKRTGCMLQRARLYHFRLSLMLESTRIQYIYIFSPKMKYKKENSKPDRSSSSSKLTRLSIMFYNFFNIIGVYELRLSFKNIFKIRRIFISVLLKICYVRTNEQILISLIF